MFSTRHYNYIQLAITAVFYNTNQQDNVSVYIYAKQKHLGCKIERGQSEATLQTGRRDQKV